MRPQPKIDLKPAKIRKDAIFAQPLATLALKLTRGIGMSTSG
jgi:hypothetical protein